MLEKGYFGGIISKVWYEFKKIRGESEWGMDLNNGVKKLKLYNRAVLYK